VFQDTEAINLAWKDARRALDEVEASGPTLP
jgi:hypothetical protein